MTQLDVKLYKSALSIHFYPAFISFPKNILTNIENYPI